MNKLLLLLAIAHCVITCSDENVPVISYAMYTEKLGQYEVLQDRIDELEQQLTEIKEEKDGIEFDLYSHDQRNNFREMLVTELSAQEGKEEKSITEYQHRCNIKTNDLTVMRKKKDNGIEATWFFGITEPAFNTRAKKEYTRIENLAEQRKSIDKRLCNEHIEYKKVVVAEILPELNEQLLRKKNVLELSYLPAYKLCGCNLDCLAKEGINKDQVSEAFVQNFIQSSLVMAYDKAIKKGIPVTQEEIIVIAAKNKMTKEVIAMVHALADELKKEIRKLTNEIDQESEQKISIFEDLKEDQNDQGVLSQ